MRHVFHVQVLQTAAGPAEIDGTELGAHYGPGGEVRSVSGAYARNLAVTNRIALHPRDAQQRALQAAQDGKAPGLARGAARASREPKLQLLLSGTTRFAFETVVEDATHLPFYISIDAETGELLRVVPAFATDKCWPSDPAQVASAVGWPLTVGAPMRYLTVTGGTGIAEAPYEAYQPAQYGLPPISIFEQLQGAYACEYGYYRLFPVPVVNGSPTFDNFALWDHAWHGQKAADAMHFTAATMNVFRQLGRNGWDGMGGEAKVVVNAWGIEGGSNNAYFINENTSYAPYRSVAINPVVGFGPGLEAAIDLVAHEWGHGVVFTSAAMLHSGTQGELHEGFADVIGHIVEKMTQQSGYGPERSSDWSHAEDSGTPFLRDAGIDDGPLGMRYHAADWNNNQTPHASGHMLSVAFRLLADGGSNPWCGAGCNVWTPGIGIDGAARVMMRTLTYYATSNAQWSDLANWAKLSAADLYSNCFAYSNRNAEWEQEQIELAFEAIGYPSGTGPYQFCWLYPY